jgi:hypothetical protein
VSGKQNSENMVIPCECHYRVQKKIVKPKKNWYYKNTASEINRWMKSLKKIGFGTIMSHL